MCDREMSLQEIIDALPPKHKARYEFRKYQEYKEEADHWLGALVTALVANKRLLSKMKRIARIATDTVNNNNADEYMDREISELRSEAIKEILKRKREERK